MKLSPITNEKQLQAYQQVAQNLTDSINLMQDNNLEGIKLALASIVFDIKDLISDYATKQKPAWTSSADSTPEFSNIIRLDPNKINIVELNIGKMGQKQLEEFVKAFTEKVCKGHEELKDKVFFVPRNTLKVTECDDFELSYEIV